MISRAKLFAILFGATVALAAVSYLLWQLWAQSQALAISEQNVANLTSERDNLLRANAANTEALATMARNRAIDDSKLTELAGELAAIQGRLNKSAEELKQLAESDPNVKAFLTTPIPDALRVRK